MGMMICAFVNVYDDDHLMIRLTRVYRCWHDNASAVNAVHDE